MPNTASIPLLAPINNPDICPLWYERWEVRTCPFGCHVSTITFFTCVVSVLSTLLVIGLVMLAFRVGKWVKKRWKGRGEEWWAFWRGWKGWSLKLVDVRRQEGEQRSLLGEA
jgi:hypothetical protein